MKPSCSILPLAAALLFLGCDYIGNPLDGAGPIGPGEGVTRKVLLEDFTGHTCPNCPSATATALQLQGIYGEENLIIVGVHVTQAFAAPVPPAGDGEFDTDFRTPAGDTYATEFGISFLPVGAISRHEFSSSILVSDGNWGSAVSEIIGEPSDMDLWFDSFTFDSGTGEVNTTVKLALLGEVTGDHNLTIYLTEDHVIADQIDNSQSPSHVHDYDHRHVLRDNLNGTWGEPIITGSANAGDTLALTYNYSLIASVLDAANCALVAYVHETATDEIWQVAERKFTP